LGPSKGSLIRRWRMKSLRLRSQLGAEVAAESSAARYLVMFIVHSLFGGFGHLLRLAVVGYLSPRLSSGSSLE
jgi:hypothetical protein